MRCAPKQERVTASTGARFVTRSRAACWRAAVRAATPLWPLFAAVAARAQTAVSTAAQPVDGPSYVPMALALLFVLGFIGAALWVLRRTGIAPRGGNGHLRMVTQLALGPRERVVIVEVGERWWLLGVGAGGITRLGSVPKGQTALPEVPAASFSALLERLRGGAR
jgi:flagellar protein FliO/FliZ